LEADLIIGNAIGLIIEWFFQAEDIEVGIGRSGVGGAVHAWAWLGWETKENYGDSETSIPGGGSELVGWNEAGWGCRLAGRETRRTYPTTV